MASIRSGVVIVSLAGIALLASAQSRVSAPTNSAPTNTPDSPIAPARPQPAPPRDPSATPRVTTGKVDLFGRAISVSCASCHANFEPNFEIRAGEQLEQFHGGLKFSHGQLTCLSCHHAKNYNLLRLAGEQPLEFAQSQTLCGQCHSKQTSDYERGAHGGMNGYWSLARGARVRKLCIDCHDPHSPAFPAMLLTFRPRDRFLKTDDATPGRSAHD